MNIKNKVLLIIVSLVLTISTLGAANYYDSGNQRFTITAGPAIPLSVTNFEGKQTEWGVGEEGTKLGVGGYGSIAYQVFLSPQIAIGGELGYMFMNSISKELLTNVPFTAKATYFPLQGTFDLHLSLSLGGTYISYNNGSKIAPFTSLELGFDWYFNESWGLGLKTGLWVVPEIYLFKDQSKLNGLGTFIPATLAVTFRQ